MSPTDFTIIKQKIQNSTILSEEEKQEWLYLLPRMGQEQIKEMDRILSIKMPVGMGAAAYTAVPVKPATSEERGASGTSTSSPPQGAVPLQSPLAGRLPHSKQVEAGQSLRYPGSESQAILPELENLKSLKVEDMRKAPSVYVFFEALGKKMAELKRTKQATLEQITESFETGPLYRAYLEAGLKLMDTEQNRSLAETFTPAEFEAIADFRASLRRILS